ncbi:MAG: hypothetical protein SGPRY_010816, partial [Prymnesium sp.]
QAGVTRLALNYELRASGLTFPVDPGADASLGGMVATGASGTNSVRYGTMKHNTLGVTAVLADGSVVSTVNLSSSPPPRPMPVPTFRRPEVALVASGGRSRKSSAGYDLTSLLVGSEGTLGVITEAALRLHPVPAAVGAATCTFPSLGQAAAAVTTLLSCGLPVSRSELLDATTIAAFNAYASDVPDLELCWPLRRVLVLRILSSPALKVAPTLFLQLEGVSEEGVAELSTLCQQCCDEQGGSSFVWASSESERRRLWEARHATYYAALALRPGSRGIVTDAVVPLSSLAQVMVETADDVKASGVVGPIFGHAGDGNFHCILLVREDDPPEYLATLRGLNERLMERTLRVGGSCTGEHGVGMGKKKWLPREFGDETVEMMRVVKRALDPLNILNPGKVIDL